MPMKNTTLEQYCEYFLSASSEKDKQQQAAFIFEHLKSMKEQAKRNLIYKYLNTFFYDDEFEDLFIETVHKFFRKLKNTENVDSFFYNLYRNNGIDLYRKLKKIRNHTSSLDVATGFGSDDFSENSKHILNKTAMENHARGKKEESEFSFNLVLELCCSFLNDTKRESVYLHYFKGIPQKEVAEKLNVSYPSVKERCLVGKQTMSSSLENYKKNQKKYADFTFTQKSKTTLANSSFFNDSCLFNYDYIDELLEKSILIFEEEELQTLHKWLFRSSFIKKKPHKLVDKWANALHYWKEKFYVEE